MISANLLASFPELEPSKRCTDSMISRTGIGDQRTIEQGYHNCSHGSPPLMELLGGTRIVRKRKSILP